MGVDIPVIWFAIIVFATLMYIIMDGFDLGIGMLFSFVGDAKERDVMVNSVAPVWDGNETWLVLGGAGLFGAFPLAYAVIIDALTIPLTAMLIGLIFRGVAFEFRFKATPSHRKFWDYSFAGGSLLATFSQGIVVGAMINGFDVEGRRLVGSSLDWFTPFNLFCGLYPAGHHVADHEKRRRAAAADARADPPRSAGADCRHCGGKYLDPARLAVCRRALVYSA